METVESARQEFLTATVSGSRTLLSASKALSEGRGAAFPRAPIPKTALQRSANSKLLLDLNPASASDNLA